MDLALIPKTLSASSLQVASLCMVRWKAEYLDRVPNFSTNSAADIGTTCHGALEKYVELVYIKKERQPELKLLESLYSVSYIETFGHADTDTDEYKDGLAMVRRWFERTDFDGVEVLTVEVKEPMEIPATDPVTGEKFTITFNYIMDRVDRLGPGEYRVVDYKSVRVPIQPDELEQKIQARVYALAVQRKYPDAEKIRVVFDLLRHDPVGIIVTKPENIATAHYLMAETQRIVDTDENHIQPTLNMECGYCVMKTTCPALTKNIDGGGIHTLSSSERIGLKLALEAQVKANNYVIGELEDLILREAVDRDALEWVSDDGSFEVQITAQRRRDVDASAVAKVIGPELFSMLGTITLGKLDELMKDPAVPQETRAALKKLIYYKTGEPRAKVKRKTTLI